MNKHLENFLEELKKVFENKLCCVFSYGSKINENSLSDINLMVIVENLSADDLESVSKISAKWMKSKNPPPVFMDKNEWFSSFDVYALEYSDIKEFHNILYGEDLIQQIDVNRNDLRFQTEHEVKNLLMRLRQNYLLYSNDCNKLKDAFIPVIKTCLTVFRTILRLKGVSVPKEHFEVIEEIGELDIFNMEVFKKLLKYKEKKCNFSKNEVISMTKELITSLRILLQYVNDL